MHGRLWHNLRVLLLYCCWSTRQTREQHEELLPELHTYQVLDMWQQQQLHAALTVTLPLLTALCADTRSRLLLRAHDNLLPKQLKHWCCLLIGLFMLCAIY
jgi:hypothetical protein